MKQSFIFRGQEVYEIDSLFGSEGDKPIHMLIGLQEEETFTTNLFKPQTNPFR